MANLQDWSETTADQGLKSYTSQIRERDTKIGAFLDFDPARGKLTVGSSPDARGPLAGLPFGLKDNIALRNFRLTCGSKMLENFVSPYSATVAEKLVAAGAVPVGKTNLDEFGMGSSTENSALGKTANPWDSDRVAGGSSGGSAAAVAAGLVPFALGTDTGGSVRQPANFCGVYGLKPTYGALSRYGLVAYASSLEVVGIVARSVGLLGDVFRASRGEDELDQSSLDWREYPDPKEGAVKRIGVLAGSLGLDPGVAEAYEEATASLRAVGYEISEIHIPHLDFAVPAYYTIATAEASANLARYNGVRYGHRPVYSENPEELVQKSRDEGFGPEVKMRILLGTYVLRSGFQDQFYLRAQRIRTALVRDMDGIFSKVDALMLPVFPTQAFRKGAGGLDAFQQKVADKFTTTANLTGLPALAVPRAVRGGLPSGVQFMAPAFCEDRLFGIAERLDPKEENAAPPPGYPDLYSLRRGGQS